MLSKESFEFNGDGESNSKTDFRIGPVAGGEYYFADQFSLGAEIQVNYLSIGDFNDDSDVSRSLISTKPVLYIRWFI